MNQNGSKHWFNSEDDVTLPFWYSESEAESSIDSAEPAKPEADVLPHMKVAGASGGTQEEFREHFRGTCDGTPCAREETAAEDEARDITGQSQGQLKSAFESAQPKPTRCPR